MNVRAFVVAWLCEVDEPCVGHGRAAGRDSCHVRMQPATDVLVSLYAPQPPAPHSTFNYDEMRAADDRFMAGIDESLPDNIALLVRARITQGEGSRVANDTQH